MATQKILILTTDDENLRGQVTFSELHDSNQFTPEQILLPYEEVYEVRPFSPADRQKYATVMQAMADG